MHRWLRFDSHPTLNIVLLGAWIAVAGVFMAADLKRAWAEDSAGAAASQWHINADTIQYDPQSDEYSAEGHVRLNREGRTLTADRMTLNQTSRLANAFGHVNLTSGQDSLSGERLEWHLDQETGTLTDGTLFFNDNHFYLKGKEIKKTGPLTYNIKSAHITTCDGPNPAWHLTGKELEVTVEGYGAATHAAFWARQVPVIYSPYLVFPVKSKRQTGLLMPEPALSERKGFQYLQPFFWAINAHSDATLVADYMERRGTRLGAEYRYMASENSYGTLMADGFEDRKVDDGQPENTEKWGYADDNHDRPNTERYWLRAKLNQSLPAKVTAKLDVDTVSDQDYLKEFQSGTNGFDYTRNLYLGGFGRDIDDYTNPVRLNQLNLNRLWSGYALNADARWYDDVIKRTQDQPMDTLQQLPSVTLDGTKKRVAGSPVYFDLLSGYTHFYRQEGTRGQRADLYPRLYYPTRPFNAFSVEPSAGLRQTYWHVDQWEPPSPEGETQFQRTIYDLRLDTSTELLRVFNFTTAGCDRLKHAIKPQVVYEYTPDQEQEDLPQFDDLDRIAPLNRITYGVTNTLVARRTPKAMPGQPQPAPIYLPFLRFKLEESFEINQYNADYERPFSPILAELDLTPDGYIFLDADALWSPYDSEFYSYNAGVRLWDKRGDNIGMDYRFTRQSTADEFYEAVPGVKSINITGVLQVTQRWRLRGGFERDIESSRLIQAGAGISYLSQCWGIDVDYKEEIEDRSIMAKIHLMGLGSFGQ
jgi:LPS-assembly protein